MIERLTQTDGLARDGHEFRYRLAAGFAAGGDVIDAACGTGYGASLLNAWRYLGVDVTLDHLETTPTNSIVFVAADLTSWVPPYSPDVFVSFETIEHLADYRPLIAAAQQARRWIILSAPVVPTRHLNPYHLHDFATGDLERLVVGDEWRHYQTVQQPSEVSEIVVFERR